MMRKLEIERVRMLYHPSFSAHGVQLQSNEYSSGYFLLRYWVSHTARQPTSAAFDIALLAQYLSFACRLQLSSGNRYNVSHTCIQDLRGLACVKASELQSFQTIFILSFARLPICTSPRQDLLQICLFVITETLNPIFETDHWVLKGQLINVLCCIQGLGSRQSACVGGGEHARPASRLCC